MHTATHIAAALIAASLGHSANAQTTAATVVRNTLGMGVCCIAQLSDLLAYLSTQSGNEMGQHLPKVQAYRDRYGV